MKGTETNLTIYVVHYCCLVSLLSCWTKQIVFIRMPWTGLVKTYNTNAQTPDSAGTATAMNSGHKTKAVRMDSLSSAKIK